MRKLSEMGVISVGEHMRIAIDDPDALMQIAGIDPHTHEPARCPAS
ncbi:hypothetical protein [Aestuariicoccus sp. MJ-SS9]|nr:hypothetical protein [Aestuariicoccus sp. MJ-SS9]MDU8913382.1 hypothetical protein [Aestuariicoccus sp. MJ-SS9]